MQGDLFPFGPDEDLPQEEAARCLAPFAALFVRIWREAWGVWENQAEEFRGMMTPTTRAGIVHNAAAERARRLLADANTVEICEALAFFKVYIGTNVVVRLKRLKRLDNGYVACNIKTKRQKSYYRHEPVEGIREGTTRLTVGYVLDRTQTSISSIVASLQYGLKRCIYWFALEAEAGEQPIITPVPLAPIPPDQKPTVRPKQSEKAEGE